MTLFQNYISSKEIISKIFFDYENLCQKAFHITQETNLAGSLAFLKLLFKITCFFEKCLGECLYFVWYSTSVSPILLIGAKNYLKLLLSNPCNSNFFALKKISMQSRLSSIFISKMVMRLEKMIFLYYYFLVLYNKLQ